MSEAFICDAIRTPIGRYGGALAARAHRRPRARSRSARCVERNPSVDWAAVDDVIFGCANQAGEDNRNVARMAALLAGLPVEVPGATVNRLCGSGMDAVGIAARAIKAGEAELMIAGGVEIDVARAVRDGQGRRPRSARDAEIYDTTIGWRFVNPLMKAQYGVDSMPETGENVAEQYKVSARGSGRASRCAARRRRRPRRRTAASRSEIVAGRRSRAARAGPARGRARRAPARRHHAREARQAAARRSARTARSPPATPRA